MILRGLPEKLMLCWVNHGENFPVNDRHMCHFNKALPEYSDRAIKRALSMLVDNGYIHESMVSKSLYEKRYGPTDELGYVECWILSPRGYGWVKTK